MGDARVLVAGVGNIFLSDDGFGVEVAARMLRRPPVAGVKVVDFGIRGVHLAYELLEGYDLLVLVDVVDVGDAPGTVVVLEPELDGEGGVFPDAHDMDPRAVLGLLADLGGEIRRVVIVGCQPAELEEGIGLSETVAAVVDRAVGLVDELVQEHLSAYAGKEQGG